MIKTEIKIGMEDGGMSGGAMLTSAWAQKALLDLNFEIPKPPQQPAHQKTAEVPAQQTLAMACIGEDSNILSHNLC